MGEETPKQCFEIKISSGKSKKKNKQTKTNLCPFSVECVPSSAFLQHWVCVKWLNSSKESQNGKWGGGFPIFKRGTEARFTQNIHQVTGSETGEPSVTPFLVELEGEWNFISFLFL